MHLGFYKKDGISAAIRELRSAVHRATIDSGFDDANTDVLSEIKMILKIRPSLLPELVTLTKARVKSSSAGTAFLAICLLDNLMHRLGFEFQEQVSIKVLGRILKLAMPQKGIHPSIQKKAAASIKDWAATFGSDPHLSSFADAAAELASKEAPQSRRTVLPPPGPAAHTTYEPLPPAPPAHRTSQPYPAPTMRPPLRQEASLTPDPTPPPPPPDLHAMARKVGAGGLTTAELLELARESQSAIAEQIRASPDGERARQLHALHRQLAADIAHYSGRAASAP